MGKLLSPFDFFATLNDLLLFVFNSGCRNASIKKQNYLANFLRADFMRKYFFLNNYFKEKLFCYSDQNSN